MTGATVEEKIVTVVRIERFAEKQIGRLPEYIHEKFLFWVRELEFYGIQEIRKNRGYHDEPLKGSRNGQRSIRLNRAYRVIYEELNEAEMIIICVMEVNKHDY